MNSSTVIIDPSQIYRPELTDDFIFKDASDLVISKDKSEFRRFIGNEDDDIQRRVKETYLKMHTNQTVDFVKNRLNCWTKFDHAEMTILEALDTLNGLVDESDVDVTIPNSAHAYQTAEGLRKLYPEYDWLHLTGLIHDIGKVMALYGEPQWAVVGDTFPVGCAYANSIVYKDTTFNDNPDLKNPAYNTKYGMYSPNCGLKQVLMSWSHDEYLYQVLQNHGHNLPPQALYIIRFHSFYPWHTGNDYMHLCDKDDLEMIRWIREFNQFDLYTKVNEFPNVEALRPYYQSLIDKYIPGVLKW